MIKIFVPSYHRPHSIKTAKYLEKVGYEMSDVYIFVDSEADDISEYSDACEKFGCNLVIFDMDEARARYDYVHRASESRRSAGQARNMFQDFAKKAGIDFYLVMDDDTTRFEIKDHGKYKRKAELGDLLQAFGSVESMMRKRRIGLFGLSQTGDFIGGNNDKCYRKKVMNTTFYLLPYIYRGERGVQDDDTSMFTGVMNEGLFTGSIGDGLILGQTESAVQPGGLTDLYHECKLVNKALVCPIQFPSAIYAERQKMNGGRVHHHIMSRYLYPMVIKGGAG